MATTAATTAAEDVAAALCALAALDRASLHLRAWLEAAERQDDPTPGTLDQARRGAAIVLEQAHRVDNLTRLARIAASLG